jgi:hypothetical protein
VVVAHAVAVYEAVATAAALLIGVLWSVLATWAAIKGEATGGMTAAAAMVALLIGAGGNIAAFQHPRDINRAKG